MSDGGHILVLDDEVVIRDSMAAFLEDYGFRVETAESAEQESEMLDDGRYELVVVDIRLPGERGDRFIQRAAERYPGMAFLIHTGSVQFRLTDELRRLGVGPEQIFLKPLHDLNRLAQGIERQLQR